jgi:hypothetical protein
MIDLVPKEMKRVVLKVVQHQAYAQYEHKLSHL